MTKAKGQALGSIFGTGARRPAVAPQPAPPPSPSPGAAALLAVVDRLESVLDAETEALKRNLPVDVAEFGNRKRQGLLELGRALRTAPALGPQPEVRERLKRFAAAAERNRAALGTQLRAVREIADIIGQTLRDAESDGTYSAVAGRA
ncbi:flagellar protein FlgN [Lichenibacterium minor]|uniref:Flagellar protein FlgN n=1 Tax=Lichenibacterium minor TaxID=2316528 RepID=A0A4Q2U7K1_9HYPH|nr:flagellar protein FlgN [Lichenibacterium minor]RYC32362.1 flagellar protein FlgN [Lichenibacterium minor]